MQVCAEAPVHLGVGAAGQLPKVTPSHLPAVVPEQVGAGGRMQLRAEVPCTAGHALLLVLHQSTLSFW